MQVQIIKQKDQSEIRNRKLRVCAYARVSTDTMEQEGSLDNQISYYRELIQSKPEYEFAGVYTDQGISGYKESRPGFQKMINDAREGNIDLIITKSVSRFARNTVTVLKYARELKDQGVGIFFELQNINTLSEQGELMLTVIAAFAQRESEEASISAKMVYRHKYEQGIPVQYLERSFGYRLDEQGEYALNADEAKCVVIIYEMAANGYPIAAIKRYLNSNGFKTVQGAAFSESTVIRIIENEIYKGDYIMQKHFVNSKRRLVKNKGEVNAWYIENDHIPIVSRRLWDKAQEQVSKRRQYLATGSVMGELDEAIYPYMNQIFCAQCGYPLYRRIYSNGNRVNWGCSGMKRFKKDFCEGINVPDSVIRSWRELNGNIYIRKTGDEKFEYKYVTESTWKRTHKKKQKKSTTILPELNECNYPYMKKLYCGECKSRLVRKIEGENVKWICNGWKRKGKGFCKGIKVADEIIRSAGEITDDIYIKRKVDAHGKECYCYSRCPK